MCFLLPSRGGIVYCNQTSSSLAKKPPKIVIWRWLPVEKKAATSASVLKYLSFNKVVKKTKKKYFQDGGLHGATNSMYMWMRISRLKTIRRFIGGGLYTWLRTYSWMKTSIFANKQRKLSHIVPLREVFFKCDTAEKIIMHKNQFCCQSITHHRLWFKIQGFPPSFYYVENNPKFRLVFGENWLHHAIKLAFKGLKSWK